MYKQYALFRSSGGLNNKVDPLRVSFNPETGFCQLPEAVNIDIDSTGRIDRRKGFTEISNLNNCHSFYSYGGYLFFISDASMYAMQGIVPTPVGTVGAWRCSYWGVGERVYFCNGLTKGYIQGNIIYPWVAGTYVGPETTKTFSDPPLGYLLHLYRGRMYIATDEAVWYSRPLDYHHYDLVRGLIQPGGKTRMINNVSTGLWIGTDEHIRYYHGDNAEELELRKTEVVKVVQGTDVVVPGRMLPVQQLYGQNVILVTTNEGVILLGPDGFSMNLTYDRLELPNSAFGSAAIINGKYIFSLEP